MFRDIKVNFRPSLNINYLLQIAENLIPEQIVSAQKLLLSFIWFEMKIIQ